VPERAHPDAFACQSVRYQIVPCSSGSSDPYNRDGSGSSDPYNRDGQCAGHSATQPNALDKEAYQLWLGNDLDQPAQRSVRVCTQYAPGGEAAYRKAIFAFSGN